MHSEVKNSADIRPIVTSTYDYEIYVKKYANSDSLVPIMSSVKMSSNATGIFYFSALHFFDNNFHRTRRFAGIRLNIAQLWALTYNNETTL